MHDKSSRSDLRPAARAGAGGPPGVRGGVTAFLVLLAVCALPMQAEARQQDAPPPAVRAEVNVAADGGAVLTLIYRVAGTEPDTLVTLARAERGGEAVVARDDGGVELHFAPHPLSAVIGPMRLAREREEGAFPVAVRIPADLRSGDIWEFQALLAQAGIRQVRIVAGDPSPEQ
jgi:hypothetical protein